MPSNIEYKNNFLDKVICRVDITPNNAISTKGPAEFHDKIRSSFPGSDEKKLVELTRTLDEKQEINEKKVIPIWEFIDKDKTKKVIISIDHIVIEFSKYSHFPEVRTIIEESYKHFTDIYKPVIPIRLGLRYINKIYFKEGNPTDWQNLIDERLTCVLDKFIQNKTEASRVFGQICYNKTDYNINFNYGILNSEFPGKISRKEFILDYDCYTKDIHEDIIQLVDKYHTEIKKLFESSIKEDLRKKMEVINGTSPAT